MSISLSRLALAHLRVSTQAWPLCCPAPSIGQSGLKLLELPPWLAVVTHTNLSPWCPGVPGSQGHLAFISLTPALASLGPAGMGQAAGKPEGPDSKPMHRHVSWVLTLLHSHECHFPSETTNSSSSHKVKLLSQYAPVPWQLKVERLDILGIGTPLSPTCQACQPITPCSAQAVVRPLCWRHPRLPKTRPGHKINCLQPFRPRHG